MGMELCRAVAPSGAIKVDAGVKAKAMQEAQKAKAQARKGSIPIGMVQQSYSRGAPVSASASSASAATVSSTKTQYGWTATRKQISF
jgi:predicted ATP-grasp superfamily ATP-dependent carboligase